MDHPVDLQYKFFQLVAVGKFNIFFGKVEFQFYQRSELH